MLKSFQAAAVLLKLCLGDARGSAAKECAIPRGRFSSTHARRRQHTQTQALLEQHVGGT